MEMVWLGVEIVLWVYFASVGLVAIWNERGVEVVRDLAGGTRPIADRIGSDGSQISGNERIAASERPRPGVERPVPAAAPLQQPPRFSASGILPYKAGRGSIEFRLLDVLGTTLNFNAVSTVKDWDEPWRLFGTATWDETEFVAREILAQEIGGTDREETTIHFTRMATSSDGARCQVTGYIEDPKEGDFHFAGTLAATPLRSRRE